ncbi:hypothetical protein F4561_000988 [Lipingzhangella halophila]|uniref:Uncharacterized protein n=1 Tax=Lipingzhangella halophila TaxID=1783352 RepID=A0A7W7RDU8_9ACTN|nr:hypothetical protein [Lipingzhangella halophila]MBB4930168.1 hypothetical protein [Lipingzhangella halophila]
MRKPSTRWVALASATTISVAGLAIASGTATADDEPRPWPVVQHDASSYTLDGFTIEYLPSGLEKHGLNAKSATNRDGGRTSDITWMAGPDKIYGKITVLRDESITTLDQIREAQYGHLDDEQLAKVDNNGRDTYLSERTGDMFWVEEPGVAVTTYLQPDTWDSDELARMAAGIEQQEQQAADPERERARTTAQEPEDALPEVPDDQVPAPAEGGPREDATGSGGSAVPGEDNAAGAASEQGAAEDTGNTGENTDLPTDVSVREVRECLAEQLAGARVEDGENAGPGAGAAPEDDDALRESWHAADQDTREAALKACAERFGVGSTVVDELITTIIEEQERASGSLEQAAANESDRSATARDALAWTLPAVPLNG